MYNEYIMYIYIYTHECYPPCHHVSMIFSHDSHRHLAQVPAQKHTARGLPLPIATTTAKESPVCCLFS